MDRVLVIDDDGDSVQQLGLACRARGLGVALAENLCEGVRVLLDGGVALIAVAGRLLRLTPHEHATLFEQVAPGVPVLVAVPAAGSREARAALSLAGFHVVTGPVTAEDVARALGGGGA